MRGTILSISPDGVETARQFEGEATLDDLQAAIGGGSVQVVPLFDIFQHGEDWHRCVVFCDEDGKVNNLTFNPKAQLHWQLAYNASGHLGALDDALVGTVAIVWGDPDFMEAL